MRGKKQFWNNAVTYGIVIVAYLVCRLAMSGSIEGFTMSRLLKSQLVPVCVYIVMAVSLNLTVGVSGELSLGHAGFMSVGAFSGIVVSQWLKAAAGASNAVRILAALLTGGAFAAMIGLFIGFTVLRLRGDYLAIVTLAFGEIIRNIINCFYFSIDGKALHFGFNNPNLNGKLVVSGPMGAVSVNRLATFEAGVLLVLFTLFVVMNLVNSRSGRAIMASRDNRIAAEAMGINVTKYKLIAFVISAALAGMAGALYGLNFASTQASKFKFDTSILVLVFVVMGGIGSIRGSMIAATLLTILPEVLREFGTYRMLVYAIVLILMMIVTNNPMLRGLLASLRPRRKKEARTE